MSSIANQTAFNGYNNITTLTWSVAASKNYTYTATEDCTILFLSASGTYIYGASFAINGTDIASFSSQNDGSTQLANGSNASDVTITEALKHNLRMLGNDKPMVDLVKGDTLTIKSSFSGNAFTVKVKKLT